MKFVLLVLMAILFSFQANAQQSTAASLPSMPIETDLSKATQQSKSADADLLTLQEAAVKKSTDSLVQLKQLYSEGLIARVELEKAEQDLAAATARVEQTKAQIASSARLTAEIQKAAEMAKSKPIKPLVKPTLMSRGNVVLHSVGTVSATLATNLADVQQFFQTTFNRPLPTSAIGQSITHDKWGWDHRNSFDVGVHPDSAEGQALISYLKLVGIPFLAFRSAIPGVATGPHIHVGNPSHRLS
jgi:hypothetical protein